ncbi:hypothetical protein PV336_15920 [Streptomyces sp. MI02-2A]|uniref:hypothetical protein n=1 Tax=Streptomyces sp. MI02-2A TaxID=3028688 RepID=UPI0029A92951|nr:hypothetical protein [Streptomyces sp. MI02-2A]MDX3260707.1 hypothetical protein [Streptomyces sp. MI02-2A]
MATYGVSIYGLTKYGTDIHPEFDVSPFTATPTDYSSVLLGWRAPAGTWDSLRLIRNRYGWAVNETDGEILLDTTRHETSFIDTGVVGGHWLYYTVFIKASGQWSRAGTASTLMPKNNGYSELLYDLVPQYYKVDVKDGNNVTDDSNTLNPFILPFLSIFGFGFDIIKSYYDSNRYTNDAMRTHYENIAAMADQFGIQYEPSAPAYLFRQRVRDAATLARQKGTLEQIRSLIAETTGYDSDLRMGVNLMLSDDQADFDHPTYPNWDPSVNYAKGERVKFGSYLYQAGNSGAYGQAQAPSGTTASNTFWSSVSLTGDTTLLNANGNIAGWEEISFTTGVTPGTSAIEVGVGVQNPTDPDDNAGNALVVKNNNSGNATATMGVRSVAKIKGQSTMDRQQPILYGVPLPWTAQEWDPAAVYVPGDIVSFHGRNYMAAIANYNTPPPNDTSSGYGFGGYGEGPYGGEGVPWEALAYDERFQVCLSGYTQSYNGQTVPVYPFIEFYDDHGALICSLYADSLPSYTVFDSFTQGWGDWAARNTDVGGLTWSEAVGQWAAGGFDGGVSYPVGTTRSMATLAGHSNGTVGVTFATGTGSARQQGVVFRMQNSSNYWRASRFSLSRISGGAVVENYLYSDPFDDGDRITVSYSGANIQVLKNGAPLLANTDTSPLVSATGIGMVVE